MKTNFLNVQKIGRVRQERKQTAGVTRKAGVVGTVALLAAWALGFSAASSADAATVYWGINGSAPKSSFAYAPSTRSNASVVLSLGGIQTQTNANLDTGAATIGAGTVSLPYGLPGSFGTITLADDPNAVLLAGGSITRNIIGLGLGDEGVGNPFNGTLWASSNLTVGSAGTVFQFNGTVDTQGNPVTIVTAEPTFTAFTGAGKGYLAASIRLQRRGTIISNARLLRPASALASGSCAHSHSTALLAACNPSSIASVFGLRKRVYFGRSLDT
jgi:hypothetical protein